MLATYVVSLNRSQDRRARVLAMLDGMGVSAEVFGATDGATLDASTIAEHYDEDANQRGFKRPLTRAEIGCYLSHLSLWATIAQGEGRAALVLEDDAEVSDSLPALLSNLKDLAPLDAILKLDGCKGDGEGTATFGGHVFACEKVIAPRTTGYIIGREAAARLSTRGRFFRPVDIDLKHYWEHGVPIFSANPPLVRERPQPSTIEASRQSAKGSALTRLAANLRYQARFRLALLKAAAPSAAILSPRKEL